MAIGLTKIVGDYDEWMLANIKDAMTKLQPEATVFDVYYTRDSMLQNCLSRSYSSFVNRVTGECNFDGQDFRDLLEFINSFPVDYDYSNYDYNKNPGGAESMKRGLQLLMDAGVFRSTPSSTRSLPSAARGLLRRLSEHDRQQ